MTEKESILKLTLFHNAIKMSITLCANKKQEQNKTKVNLCLHVTFFKPTIPLSVSPGFCLASPGLSIRSLSSMENATWFFTQTLVKQNSFSQREREGEK